jgi:hypothetical protein
MVDPLAGRAGHQWRNLLKPIPLESDHGEVDPWIGRKPTDERHRFSEEQALEILREREAGMPTAGVSQARNYLGNPLVG